jgi:hypothetical protein
MFEVNFLLARDWLARADRTSALAAILRASAAVGVPVILKAAS